MGTLKARIERFCEVNCIAVPVGFRRGAASRYVVVKRQEGEWRLVAKTWFTVADVLFYLDIYCEDIEYRVFDFKDHVELARRGEKEFNARPRSSSTSQPQRVPCETSRSQPN